MFIDGELASLGPLYPDRADFVGSMERWVNDNDATRLMFTGLMPTSFSALRSMWTEDVEDPNTVAFSVYSTGPLIGTAGLYSINWIARTAEFRIFLGNKEYWGKGIGTEVTRLVVRYGFERLNLHNIWLGVNVENRAAVRVYEKAGFTHEGRLRQCFYRNNRYYDVFRMSLLREEWKCTEQQ